MSSIKGQSVLLSDPISEPESLDLDYDMWQGQFEIIGQTSSGGGSSGTAAGTTENSHSSVDDSNLNLVFDRVVDPSSRAPILIDEETFLSLHPSDFMDSLQATDDAYDPDGDGPHSGLFIHDAINGVGGGGGGGGSSGHRKNKRIDNFFNANLQKIFLMNNKNVADSLGGSRHYGEKRDNDPDTETVVDKVVADLNNNEKSTFNQNHRTAMKTKCDTLNDQVRTREWPIAYYR